MTTQLNQVNFTTWSKTTLTSSPPPFRRDDDAPSRHFAFSTNQSIVIRRFYRGASDKEERRETIAVEENSSARKVHQYSESFRKNLENARKTFLGLHQQHQQVQATGGNQDGEKKIEEIAVSDHTLKKASSGTPRKISFKCKKPFSARRPVSASTTVSELTSKFNKIAGNKIHHHYQQDSPVTLTPPTKNVASTKMIVRRTSIKSAEKNNQQKLSFRDHSNVTGTVRATIEIFERRNSQSSPTSPSDKVPVPSSSSSSSSSGSSSSSSSSNSKLEPPDKNLHIRTEDLVVRNGVKKLKTCCQDGGSTSDPAQSAKDKEEPLSEKKTTETRIAYEEKDDDEDFIFDAQEDKEIHELEERVEILSIPLVMPKRCDSSYETATLKKVPPDVKPNASFLWRRQKPQCYEEEGHRQDSKTNLENLYDFVESPHEETIPEEESPSSSSPPPAVPARPTTLSLNFPSRPIFKKKMPLPDEIEDYDNKKTDEENEDQDAKSIHSYESCQSSTRYEDVEDDDEDTDVDEDGVNYAKSSDDGYERFDSVGPIECHREEVIYETLPFSPPPTFGRIQEEPLPPRPASRESCSTLQNSVSNCYESIYNSSDLRNDNYESIYDGAAGNKEKTAMADHCWESLSANKRDSVSSSGQQSNSLYGRSLSGWNNEEGNGVYNGKATSDLSSSDKSDDWVDISDNDDQCIRRFGQHDLVALRQKSNGHRKGGGTGWSEKIRNQWNKSHSSDLGDSDHHYESLLRKRNDPDYDEFDSFDSDTESENSLSKTHQNDSGVDMSNSQLPDPPSSSGSSKESSNGLTKFAESAGKHMRRLRRNWSLTKNDITKSLSRMANKKKHSATVTAKPICDDVPKINRQVTNVSSDGKAAAATTHYASPKGNPITLNASNENTLQQGIGSSQEFVRSSRESVDFYPESIERSRANSLSKSKFLSKFRRSISGSGELSQGRESGGGGTQVATNKPKSTFYLTETVNVDDVDDKSNIATTKKLVTGQSAMTRMSRSLLQRPQSPPPPIPLDAALTSLESSKNNKNVKRSTSWYTECGVFGTIENESLNKPTNTSWYAEIGLYRTSGSTPTTSSAENSGNNSLAQQPSTEVEQNNECYYNLKNNESIYYNEDRLIPEKGISDKTSFDFQLRLQDEPLYQFYDAAVLDSVCGSDGSSEYEGYEEVEGKQPNLENCRLSVRPSAMQIVSKLNGEGVTINRTLWCEIPEVVQSAVLSTLSPHQKKIQEAKFEMMTSEASYLNSLNVLTDHFLKNLKSSQLLSLGEIEILFGQIISVKQCSERLLHDLEVCWQDNILLHGICEIVKRHANETFHVYVSYCENQILLNSTLQQIKERSDCNELLKHLESSSACQSLTLYSFLMLPMQRVTRWPLLVDAVLKRLSPQDDEYLSCQFTLATLNKIVNQCNEAARSMERHTEMKRISKLIEFPKNISPVKLSSVTSRWLVRSGPLIQMQSRSEDSKLTFGKRLSKINIHLFLFNDLLIVTRPRSDDMFVVGHYCWRSYIEVSSDDSVPGLLTKDVQGRNLLFLTLLENQEGKTVEMLLSCNSESDRERWLEALSSPRSEDPDETLYERWDCPQVAVVHNYAASQPDELALTRGDVVNVTRKMADGWYHGERIRDGQVGWFPANYTTEIANPHVRARNLKQRYRLLAFSENYLKSK